MQKTIAVTGGTGFLGYHLIPELLNAGYTVRLLNRPGSVHPLMRQYPAGVEVRELLFENIAEISLALQGVAAVIHAAGLVSYRRKDQSKMYDVHIELTRKMLAAAKSAAVKRFIHVSSIVTLGHGRELRNENSDFNAASLALGYWDTKKLSEEIALQANAPGFEVVAALPGSLLGAGEKNGQLESFIKKIARAEAPFLPTGGSDFVDAKDVAMGIIRVLEKGSPGEKYILGGENLSYLELHQRIRHCLEKKSRARLLPRAIVQAAKIGLVFFATLSAKLRRVDGIFLFHDLSKAKKELGYAPQSIDYALREMLKRSQCK